MRVRERESDGRWCRVLERRSTASKACDGSTACRLHSLSPSLARCCCSSRDRHMHITGIRCSRAPFHSQSLAASHAASTPSGGKAARIKGWDRHVQANRFMLLCFFFLFNKSRCPAPREPHARTGGHRQQPLHHLSFEHLLLREKRRRGREGRRDLLQIWCPSVDCLAPASCLHM